MDDLERVVAAQTKSINRWAAVGAVAQARESADTESQAKQKWSKIYRLFEASGESAQDEVFAAVNMYFLVNGCSPSGKYRKPITTAGGIQVQSGEVTKVTGKLEGEIRQFLRGRLLDSYNFLKYNEAVKSDDHLVTAAQNAGVNRDLCWLMADWLGRDCPYFVGDEAEVFNKLRTSKIAAAHQKAVVALPDADRVYDATPESKMPTRSGAAPESNGLF